MGLIFVSVEQLESRRRKKEQCSRSLVGNATDSWRRELMALAQQVKSSLIVPDEREPQLHRSRSSLRSHERIASSLSDHHPTGYGEHEVSKRLLNRRESAQSIKPVTPHARPELEPANSDENQDPGIWVQPTAISPCFSPSYVF